MHTSTAPVRAFLGAGLAGVVVFTGAVATATTATADTQTGTTATSATEEPGELLLMLDASGSMKESDPAGGTKMQAAKTALTGVVESLPSDTDVGLRVYGATEPGGKPTKAACADTQLAVPIGPLDKPALTKAINGFQAKGETPIAHSLTKAMDDLGGTGQRNIILVSDGEESCVPDPCPVVKDLVQDGIDLRIDTVGFGVKDTAREQLQCIADAGGGTYYDAADAEELATSLNKLSTRALRDFTVEGTPITMTEDKADAPTITPGRYTDQITVSDKPRYAYVTRTPNSNVHVAIVARPPFKGRDTFDRESLELAVSTPDGERCSQDSGGGIAFGRNAESFALATSVNDSPTDPTDDDACATSEELLVEVMYDEGIGKDIPLQLVYVEEPPVKDVASLPAPVDPEKVTGWTARGDGSPEAVVGGGGFANASTLSPGSYEDTILPGEQLYYRVRVDYGQRAAFTASIDGTPVSSVMAVYDYQALNLQSFNPVLSDITRVRGALENRDHIRDDTKTLVLGEYIPEVRYRNKGLDPYQTNYDKAPLVSMAGYYYFTLSRDTDRDELTAPVDVRIDVDVKGEALEGPQFVGVKAPAEDAMSPSKAPTSANEFAGDDETSAAAAGTSDEGGSPLPWIGGGLLAALVLAAGAWVGLRRKGAQESARSQE